jgi:hypothetical protein
MKTIRFFLAYAALVAALFLTSAISVMAQVADSIVVPPPFGPGANLQDFLNLYAGLEAAIILLAGYLHNWIPGLNMIRTKWLRIVLIGAVVAVIFAALGLNSGIGTVFIFLQTVGFYEIILKKALPSPPITGTAAATGKPAADR